MTNSMTKKRINQISCFLLIISAVIIFSFPQAYAVNDMLEAMVDHINNGVIEAIQENLTGDGDSSEFYTYVTATSGEDNIIVTVSNIMKVVGAFLCIIYGMMRIFENMERGMDPMESITKAFKELCLVGFFMINIDLILDWFVEFGNFLIESVGSVFDITEAGGIDLETISGDTGLVFGPIDWTKVFLILVIPWLLSVLMRIAALFISFSLLIEIGIRRAFAPMAVADIYGEGMRSPGMRYLKRYLATYAKIAICLLVCMLGSQLMGIVSSENITDSSSMTEMLDYIFKVIAINFTVIGVMTKTGEYANDIVGV